MKKLIILLMSSFVIISIAKAQSNSLKKDSSLLRFWKNCEEAFKKNDTNAIKKVVKLPVRMNLFGSEMGDNPNLTLKQFLKEVRDLNRYNFKKYKPTLNNDFIKYEAFKGYIFSKDCKYYEVQMSRKTSKHEGFSITLYIEEKNGIFRVFAFGGEDPWNNYGN
jgi:hypothetical protein